MMLIQLISVGSRGPWSSSYIILIVYLYLAIVFLMFGSNSTDPNARKHTELKENQSFFALERYVEIDPQSVICHRSIEMNVITKFYQYSMIIPLYTLHKGGHV